MSLLPASGEFVSEFPSPRHLSSSSPYPLALSGLGDPAGSSARFSGLLDLTVPSTTAQFNTSDENLAPIIDILKETVRI
jgi:hypothetical protein